MSRKLLRLAVVPLLFLEMAVPLAWARKKWDDLSQIGKRSVAQKSIVSQEKENEIGRAYAAQLDAKLKMVTDFRINKYISGVAQKVAQNSDLKIPLIVKVYASREMKSFTVPGGYIYLTTGFIETLDDEGELAGVLSYGVADLAVRHWAAEVTRATVLQYAMLPAIFTPAKETNFYGPMQDNVNGVPLSFAKFARDDAAESDYLGLEYLYKAGYAPQSYVALLEKIAKVEDALSKQVPVTFRDAPPARERIVNCQKEIARILPPRVQPAADNSAFNEIKNLLKSSPSPPDVQR